MVDAPTAQRFIAQVMTEWLNLLGLISGLREAFERPNIALALFALLFVHRFAQHLQD